MTSVNHADFIQPGHENRVMKLHKTVRGEHVALVDVTDHAVYIRVLPTSHPDVGLVSGDPDAFWATVTWHNNTETWTCSLNGPGYSYTDLNPDKHSSHMTLKSALRRARKHTQKNAGVPIYNLTEHLNLIPELKSVYPTQGQIKSRIEYEKWYWASVRAEHEQEAEHVFSDEYPLMSEADF